MREPGRRRDTGRDNDRPERTPSVPIHLDSYISTRTSRLVHLDRYITHAGSARPCIGRMPSAACRRGSRTARAEAPRRGRGLDAGACQRAIGTRMPCSAAEMAVSPLLPPRRSSQAKGMRTMVWMSRNRRLSPRAPPARRGPSERARRHRVARRGRHEERGQLGDCLDSLSPGVRGGVEHAPAKATFSSARRRGAPSSSSDVASLCTACADRTRRQTPGDARAHHPDPFRPPASLQRKSQRAKCPAPAFMHPHASERREGGRYRTADGRAGCGCQRSVQGAQTSKVAMQGLRHRSGGWR